MVVFFNLNNNLEVLTQIYPNSVEKSVSPRMASFRGQEIFPMVSGDAPRCTNEVSRKKR